MGLTEPGFQAFGFRSGGLVTTILLHLCLFMLVLKPTGQAGIVG